MDEMQNFAGPIQGQLVTARHGVVDGVSCADGVNRCCILNNQQATHVHSGSGGGDNRLFVTGGGDNRLCFYWRR